MVLMAIGRKSERNHATENQSIAGDQRPPQDLCEEVRLDIMAVMSVRNDNEDSSLTMKS